MHQRKSKKVLSGERNYRSTCRQTAVCGYQCRRKGKTKERRAVVADMPRVILLLAACVAASSGLSIGRCPGCETAWKPEDVTAARIDVVKQQILSKLRLSEPPSPNLTLAALPRPLAAAPDAHLKQNSFEEFYGKTDQVILFPDNGLWNLFLLITHKVGESTLFIEICQKFYF
jgi:hypothetical protein